VILTICGLKVATDCKGITCPTPDFVPLSAVKPSVRMMRCFWCQTCCDNLANGHIIPYCFELSAYSAAGIGQIWTSDDYDFLVSMLGSRRPDLR
jgi:hypothetical protein